MQFLKRLYWQQSAKLVYRRGITYEQKQRYQRAVDAFSRAIAMGYFPMAKAVVHRGINRMHLQDRSGAIADFESVIQAEKIDAAAYNLSLAQAYFYRGQLHQQQGDESAALGDWSKATSSCSTYSLPYYYRALILLDNGKDDRALFELNAAIEAYPMLPLAYFQRGELRLQLGDKSGAIADLTCAVRNDFTLEEAKEKLKHLQQDTHNTQLSQVLREPLAKQGLSVKVYHKGARLDVCVYRAVGTGINYYILPTIIRKHLVPLALDEVSRFQLIGRAGEATQPDWNQSYRLYQDQPCPPSHWKIALAAMVMFPPLAVPAFIQAARVRSAYKAGKYVEALSASKVAKVLGLASSIPFSFFLFLTLICASYNFDEQTPTFSTVEESRTAKRPERKIEIK